jgi:hypothetical protein
LTSRDCNKPPPLAWTAFCALIPLEDPSGHLENVPDNTGDNRHLGGPEFSVTW